jgi:hypothetical protein
MNPVRNVRHALGILAFTTVLPAISAASFTIRRDGVVPVVFERDLSVRNSRTGDRFYVRVEGDRDLPSGTRMVGKIVDIRKASGSNPAYMDLRFTDILLPTGRRIPVSAYPIQMNDRYVRRDRDGRFTATDNVKKREMMVLGGTAAGLILGSIIRRPNEGTVLGAIAGIVLSENERKNGTDVVVTKGQKLGALFDRDVYVDTSRYTGSDDWRRDDNYDDRDDRYRDDSYRDDQYRDRDGRYDEPYASSSIRISYQDRDLTYSDRETPFRDTNTVMVPLRRTAEQLDLRVEEGRSGVFYIENDDHTLRLERDNREYRFDGSRGTLERTLVEKDDVIFVPIEVFAKIKGEKIYVNGNSIVAKSF